MNRRCPNCDNEAQAGDRYCPHCGMDLFWKPDRTPPRISGQGWLLAVAGFVAVFIALGVAPIGLPILLVACIALRGSSFARGVAFGCALLALLALGAFAVCLVGLSRMGR